MASKKEKEVCWRAGAIARIIPSRDALARGPSPSSVGGLTFLPSMRGWGERAPIYRQLLTLPGNGTSLSHKCIPCRRKAEAAEKPAVELAATQSGQHPTRQQPPQFLFQHQKWAYVAIIHSLPKRPQRLKYQHTKHKILVRTAVPLNFPSKWPHVRARW